MKPYTLTIKIDGELLDTHHNEDPFHRTTIVRGWNSWDWFRMLFKSNRRIVVEIHQSAPIGAIQRVMTCLHEDCVGCGTGDIDTHGDHVEGMVSDACRQAKNP